MLEYIRNITAKRDEEGASAVEYGLLVAGIAALIVLVVFLFGGMIKDVFSGTCDKIQTSATAITFFDRTWSVAAGSAPGKAVDPCAWTNSRAGATTATTASVPICREARRTRSAGLWRTLRSGLLSAWCGDDDAVR